ncbi:hypothetical protein D3C72_2382050 [compost metagenome]
MAPRLIPATTRSATCGSNPFSPRCTQSVGVPLRLIKPLGKVHGCSGRSRVSELLAPLLS